jgi:chromosome segregation ATPase
MDRAKALREAKKEAKAAAKAQELAEQEATVVDKARRAVAEAKEDTKDEHVVRELAEKKLATLSAQNRQLAERTAELQEDLDIRARAETNVRATLQKSNSSLSAEKQQVLLLQKRTGTLEGLEQREAKERSEVENERAQIEGQAEELKDKLAAAQAQVKKQTDELADVKGRWKQAEANENEYFDSMTSLQSAKDDLSQQLTDSQKAAAASQKKADDLEKTNEYLRGEQQSTDAAGQAAMSDYLKEIEAMKLEEEKQTATIAQQSAEMGELHQAAADLWKELTPAQRKQMQARAKKAPARR